jgi:hypothetical protein
VPVAANNASLSTLRRPQVSDTIKTGTILIKEGTLLPEAVRFDSECSVPGWKLVKDLDRCGLDREIREAGWTLFCLAGEIRATVFGIDEERMVRRTIEEILARLKSEKFNSLEITRVTTYPGPGSIGCRLNQGGCQATGTVSESNGDRSGLGRAREHKNEGCGG